MPNTSKLDELKQEIVYLNKRMDTLESIHGELFKLDLEELKERRDTLYDSLNDPISDNAKGRINIDIIKIERLINIRMKEVNSNGKDTQETS